MVVIFEKTVRSNEQRGSKINPGKCALCREEIIADGSDPKVPFDRCYSDL